MQCYTNRSSLLADHRRLLTDGKFQLLNRQSMTKKYGSDWTRNHEQAACQHPASIGSGYSRCKAQAR